jgi:hypothetical protein
LSSDQEAVTRDKRRRGFPSTVEPVEISLATPKKLTSEYLTGLVVELCRNVVFRRHFPIHKIFERSCELGVFRLTADVITQIFGVRKHKRLRGKLHTMLEKVDHGHHVLRIYCKSLVARMYEEFGTFLRIEVCVNPSRISA